MALRTKVLSDHRAAVGRSVLYLVGDILVRAPGFVLLPVYTALLSPGDYGIVALATVVTTLSRPVLSLGLQAAGLKFFFDFEDETDRAAFYGSLWMLLIFGSGALYLLLDVVGGGLFDRVIGSVAYDPYIRLALVTAYITGAFLDLPLQIFKASGRSGAYSAFNFAHFALVTAATLYFLVVENAGAWGVVGGTALGTGLTGVVGALVLLPRVKLKWNGRWMARAVLFSLPMVPHFGSQWFLASSDRIVLEHFVPLSEVGIYSVGYKIGWMVAIFYTAMTKSMIPVYGGLDRSSPAALARLARMTTYYLAILIFVGTGVAVFGEDVVRLMAPIEYARAGLIVPWVALGAIAMAAYSPSVQVLNIVLGRTRLIGVATVMAAATNVGLNILLIPVLGIAGAAVATAVSYAALAGGVLFFAQRALRIPYEYGRITVLFVASSAVVVVGLVVSSHVPAIVASAVKVMLVGGGAIAVLSSRLIASEERAQLARIPGLSRLMGRTVVS